MKDFINNILPSIKAISKKIDDETILKNQHWVLLDEKGITGTTYIFRDKKQLLVSIDGDVCEGTWEYLTNDKILINLNGKMLLYRNQYFDDKILTLKKDNSEIYSVLINEKLISTGYDDINKIEEFLKETYQLKERERGIPTHLIESTINEKGLDKLAKKENQDENVKTIIFVLVFVFLMIFLYVFYNQNSDIKDVEVNTYNPEDNIIDSNNIIIDSLNLPIDSADVPKF